MFEMIVNIAIFGVYLHKIKDRGMRKLAILMLFFALGLQAQNVRTNYRSEGMTHISTDYEVINLNDIPAQVKVELVGFPDGSALYLIYMNLVQKTATVVPKGVKMAATLHGGKVIRLEQIGQSSSTPRRQEDGNFLNRLKYAVEPAEMERMVKGVNSLDIVTGWNPEDYIQASFADDAFGKLLGRHCQAILKASENTVELQATMSGYTENTNSIMSTANPIVARGANYDYNILLSHLYYKGTNQEDIDLAFVIGSNDKKFHIGLDAPVRFTLGDGSVVDLLQARDDVNFVYLYPTMEDLYRICALGITGLSIEYEDGTMQDYFTPGENGFSDAVNQEFQLLLSMSPR